MRIFETITASTNASISNNKTWYRNLYEPLVDMGHDVVLFPAYEGKIAMRRKCPRMRGAFSERLLDTFKREYSKRPFDLFFAYLMDGMVDSGAIDEIRKTGVLTCNFSCNNAHQFYLVDEISPHFDYNLHSEKDAREKFIGVGANPVWWPMASNPKYFRPYKVKRDIEASFVGASYALRAKYIQFLLRNKVDVHAFGPGWKSVMRTPFRSLLMRYILLTKALGSIRTKNQSRFSAMAADMDFRRRLGEDFPNNLHYPVSDEDLIQLYSRSQISLGFLEVYENHDPSSIVTQHLHLRDFEAPMSGALYCTGYMDELAEMFEPEKEVITYRNQYELLDKVRHYLNNEPEAERIRKAGREKALNDHTYHRRFEKLFHDIGLEVR